MKIAPFEAVVQQISEPQTITNAANSASFTKQIIEIKVDGAKDELGNQTSDDEVFELQVTGRAIDRLDLLNKGLLGFRVIVSVYLNSNKYKSGYITNLTLSSIKKL